MNGSYVDDLIRAGGNKLFELAKRTHNKFDTIGDEEPTMKFAGLEISKPTETSYAIEQTFNLKNLEPLATDAKWAEFSSKRMQLAWTANTRPDLCVDISQLTSETKESFAESSEKCIKRFNKSLRFA